MHKTMSRIVVLLLVACLALGNVVPALAADDTGSAGAVTPAAETSPAATAEATAAPAATPAAETPAGTETTPTAAPTPTAETTETPATEEPPNFATFNITTVLSSGAKYFPLWTKRQFLAICPRIKNT